MSNKCSKSCIVKTACKEQNKHFKRFPKEDREKLCLEFKSKPHYPDNCKYSHYIGGNLYYKSSNNKRMRRTTQTPIYTLSNFR